MMLIVSNFYIAVFNNSLRTFLVSQLCSLRYTILCQLIITTIEWPTTASSMIQRNRLRYSFFCKKSKCVTRAGLFLTLLQISHPTYTKKLYFENGDIFLTWKVTFFLKFPFDINSSFAIDVFCMLYSGHSPSDVRLAVTKP